MSWVLHYLPAFSPTQTCVEGDRTSTGAASLPGFSALEIWTFLTWGSHFFILEARLEMINLQACNNTRIYDSKRVETDHGLALNSSLTGTLDTLKWHCASNEYLVWHPVMNSVHIFHTHNPSQFLLNTAQTWIVFTRHRWLRFLLIWQGGVHNLQFCIKRVQSGGERPVEWAGTDVEN